MTRQTSMTSWPASALLLASLSMEAAAHGSHLEAAREAERVHHFRAAEHHLREQLSLDRNNAQAWLSLASIETVRGDLDVARQACAQAARQLGAVMALACRGRIALAGGGEELAALNALLRTLEHPAVRDRNDPMSNWAWGVAAELAAAIGDVALTDRLFHRALREQPAVHLQAAYLDHLIATGRPGRVLEIVQPQEHELALALRRLLAERDTHWSEDAQRRAAQMHETFQAWMANDDFTHGREMGMFYLDVFPDAEMAYLAARRNLQVQRELEDRVILRRAHAAAEHAF